MRENPEFYHHFVEEKSNENQNCFDVFNSFSTRKIACVLVKKMQINGKEKIFIHIENWLGIFLPAIDVTKELFEISFKNHQKQIDVFYNSTKNMSFEAEDLF